MEGHEDGCSSRAMISPDKDAHPRERSMAPPPLPWTGLTARTQKHLSDLQRSIESDIDRMFPKSSSEHDPSSDDDDVEESARSSLKAGVRLMTRRLGKFTAVMAERRNCDYYFSCQNMNYRYSRAAYKDRKLLNMSEVTLPIECLPPISIDKTTRSYVTLTVVLGRNTRGEWVLRDGLSRLTANHMPYSCAVLRDMAGINPSSDDPQAARHVLVDLSAGVELGKAARTATVIKTLTKETSCGLDGFLTSLNNAFAKMLDAKVAEDTRDESQNKTNECKDLAACIRKGSQYLTHQMTNAIAATKSAHAEWVVYTIQGTGTAYNFRGVHSWTPLSHDWKAENIPKSLQAVADRANTTCGRSVLVAIQPVMLGILSTPSMWGDMTDPGTAAVLAIRQTEDLQWEVDPKRTQIIIDHKVVTEVRNSKLGAQWDDCTSAP